MTDKEIQEIVSKCSELGSSSQLTLILGLVTIIFTSPLILKFMYFLISLWEKYFKYNEWLAVFLANDQVYFGRLGKLTKNDLELRQIYYLQAKNVNESNEIGSLIKLGNEIHGPEDFMLINRQHILFLENLKEDGEVVRMIKNM